MFRVTIDDKYIVNDNGTSDGTQIKYLYEGYWYKLDRYGGEGLAEYIASILLRNSNLQSDEYVCYEQGLVNGRAACRSASFLKSKDESFITLYRLYHNVYGKNLAEVTSGMQLEDRVKLVLDFAKEYTGLDLRRYLANTFAIDRIILNEDRHFNNLGVILTNDTFREAPIFDNGKSLLVGNRSYGRFDSIEEKVKKVVARPFSGSHEWQFEFFKEYCDIEFDVPKILKELGELEQTSEVEVAIFQVKKYLTLHQPRP